MVRTLWKADPTGRLRLSARTDAKGNVLEAGNFTPDGRPQKFKEGNHRSISRYDSRGNTIEWAAFGLNGEPVGVSVHDESR